MTSPAPLLSVVVAATGRDDLLVERTVASLAGQTDPHWEVVIATNSSGAGETLDVADRARVTTVDYIGSVADGWLVATAFCRGSYVMILDAGSTLAPRTLEIVTTEISRHGPDGPPDLLYGDEDMVDADGRRSNAFYKPAFSPDRLRVQDYLGEAVLYRREVIGEIGGLNPSHGPWARFDLTLRCAEQAEVVVHVAAIMVHQWTGWPTEVADCIGRSDNVAARLTPWSGCAEVVQEHLDRTRFPARVVDEVAVPDSGRRQSVAVRLEPALTVWPKVSVIVPTGGSSRVVRGRRQRLIDLALSSMSRTAYPDYEVIVVFDRDADAELLSSVGTLVADRPHSLVQDHRPFNYSQACNLGAARSSGEVFLFLNDDTEIVHADWMTKLVMYATRPQIGAVGVKLVYEDGRLQHTGVWARSGHVAHRYAGFAGDHAGVRGSLLVQQNCSAVTAACLAVERAKFEDVGGFCTALPLAFNDVDLCFKLQMAGYRSVIDGDNVVGHLESSSRNPSTHQWELDHLHHRWRPIMYFDPYDNPNNGGRNCDEYPPTPPEMADARWDAGAFQRDGRVWRRSPLTADLRDGHPCAPELVEIGVRL